MPPIEIPSTPTRSPKPEAASSASPTRCTSAAAVKSAIRSVRRSRSPCSGMRGTNALRSRALESSGAARRVLRWIVGVAVQQDDRERRAPPVLEEGGSRRGKHVGTVERHDIARLRQTIFVNFARDGYLEVRSHGCVSAGLRIPCNMTRQTAPPKRCAWATTEASIRYHDEEWGRPVHDDRRLFEMVVLEGAQAGLSWETIYSTNEPTTAGCSSTSIRSGLRECGPRALKSFCSTPASYAIAPR